MDPYRALLDQLGIQHNIPADEIQLPRVDLDYIYSMDDDAEEDTFDLALQEQTFEEETYYREPLFHLDYDQEIHHAMNFKKKHRYSRKDRFRHTLYQLLGMSGEVPKRVVKIIKTELGPRSRKQKIWNDIRAILKKHKLRRYYNRIPSLIKSVCGLKPMLINSQKVTSILDTFFLFDYNFNILFQRKWDRKYFPNLRFIALKLINDNQIEYPYHVPLIRTSRKKKYLELLFKEFKHSCCV